DLKAVADRDGRYRLTGLAKGEGNVIRAGPGKGQPYLMATRRVPDTPGLEPVTIDLTLKRGVWVTGRVLDKVTRRPVAAAVQDVGLAATPHRKEGPDLPVGRYLRTHPEDGTFRVVALPGRGLLAARGRGDTYRIGVGADKIKGLDQSGHFQTVPHLLFAQ